MDTNTMIGSQIIELEAVESTNNYALELIRAGKARHGMVITTDNQWGGRGRQSKKWDSAIGKNLTCSAILSPNNLHPGRQFLISQAIALAICDFLYFYLPKDAIRIKWPNDIYHEGRKISGILIENLIFGNNFQWSVVGIGINLNQLEFSPGIPNPISVRQILGRSIDKEQALQQLIAVLQGKYSYLESGDWESLQKAYLEKLLLMGENVRFRCEDEIHTGKINGVDEYGRLLITGLTGQEHAYMMDEVKLLTTWEGL